MSTKPSCWTKFWCFCFGSDLVRPSAGIWLVEIQAILMRLSAICSRNQCWRISTCFSFVTSVGRSLVSNLMVCWLSQLMTKSWSSRNPTSSNKRFHQRASVAACVKASNSASVVDVVTVFCLTETQSMGPPNSLKRYPSELRLVVAQFPKLASLATSSGLV